MVVGAWSISGRWLGSRCAVGDGDALAGDSVPSGDSGTPSGCSDEAAAMDMAFWLKLPASGGDDGGGDDNTRCL